MGMCHLLVASERMSAATFTTLSPLPGRGLDHRSWQGTSYLLGELV